MQTYILLLRGINVGGHKKIKMADLKKLLESLGLKNVTTYIQSGNVVFSAEKSNVVQLQKNIEEKINAQFGFDAKCFISTAEELKRVFENNPFLLEENIDIKTLYCTFLFEEPEASKMDLLVKIDAPGEEFRSNHSIIYFNYKNGYGTAKISNPLIESKLKVGATTRNWKTVTKLMEMAWGE